MPQEIDILRFPSYTPYVSPPPKTTIDQILTEQSLHHQMSFTLSKSVPSRRDDQVSPDRHCSSRPPQVRRLIVFVRFHRTFERSCRISSPARHEGRPAMA